jgi:hypothetical protein
MMGFIRYLEKEGVDVRQLKTAFQPGDNTAVTEWFEKSQKIHHGGVMNDSFGS